MAGVRRLHVMGKHSRVAVTELNLHPYDGVDRHYCHTDADPAAGLAIVTQVLGLPETPSGEGLFYDLSIYSGGCGVLDRLAIAIPADPGVWAAATAALEAREPEDAARVEGWAEDFIWLLDGDGEPLHVREAAARFVNSERRSFQMACAPYSRMLFQSHSDVNDWAVIWGDETHLNYLGYSQG